MLVLSFRNGNDVHTKDSFDVYYMRQVETKGFNALIDNKAFFNQPAKKQARSVWQTCRNVKR